MMSNIPVDQVLRLEFMGRSAEKNHLSEIMTLALAQPEPETLYGRVMNALDLKVRRPLRI